MSNVTYQPLRHHFELALAEGVFSMSIIDPEIELDL